MKKQNKSKIGSVVMAGMVVAGALVGAVGWDLIDSPEVQIKEVIVEKTVTELVEVPVEVKGDEVIVEKIVENTDSYDRLEELLQEREIFDDAYSVLEQVEAEDKAIALAVAEIHSELADELDDEGLVDDDDDVDDIDVEEDYDEIKVLKSDFEDDEYKFEFQVEFEDEEKDEKFDVLVTVEVEDGNAKIKKVELD